MTKPSAYTPGRYHVESRQQRDDETGQTGTRYRVVDAWHGREVFRSWDRDAAYRMAESRERQELTEITRVTETILAHAGANQLAGRHDCIPSYSGRDGSYRGDQLSPSYVPWDESDTITPLAGGGIGRALTEQVARSVAAWRAKH